MIFLVGAPRSYTTLTAKIFQACGADFGAVNGLMENPSIRDGLIKPYLASIGCDPLAQAVLPDVRGLLPIDGFAERIDAPFLKDVKLPLIWPVFAEAFPAAKWVVIRRDRERIIQSCIRTSFMRHHGADRAAWSKWLAVHERRLEEIAAQTDSVTVWPRKFIDGDDEEMVGAVNWAGLVYDKTKAYGALKRERTHG